VDDVTEAKDALMRELQDLPESDARQVLDFIRFLKSRRGAALESAVLSERALAVDWLRPEEDEAWADL
jgi:hypothetical protein